MKPFSNFKVHFFLNCRDPLYYCSWCLCSNHRPNEPYLNAMLWVGRKKWSLSWRNSPGRLCSGRSRCCIAHAHFIPKGAKASQSSFQATSVIGCTLETFRIQTVCIRSKWNREVKIYCIGWIQATFLGMHFAAVTEGATNTGVSHRHRHCLLNKTFGVARPHWFGESVISSEMQALPSFCFM